ncbi:MAG: hypothetical protein RLO17_19720 [Cyclobacteriaceae bacterium]
MINLRYFDHTGVQEGGLLTLFNHSEELNSHPCQGGFHFFETKKTNRGGGLPKKVFGK